MSIECLTVSPGIGTGREEDDGDLCFGLSLGAVFNCVSSPDGIASCAGNGSQYVVVWAEESSSIIAAPSARIGRVYDELGGRYLALVFRNYDGAYVVEWGNGELGVCQSALADYCLHRPE
ncbi:MAG: hypothetical protein WDO74_10245 [Pseudomonadota bacterium]